MEQPFIPIARPLTGEEEQRALAEVLASGQLAAGAQTARFEEEFARYIGVPYGSATSNGTTALHAALAAVGVGPGDRVITTTFSFVATANAILFCGATPVFTDIDPVTYNMDPGSLAAALEAVPDAKAVLVVHLFGLPADMDAIGRLCAERGIPLVEDCAQAHGARYGQGKVGGFGAAGCFSFYATKNMTTGEGGMVVTGSEAVHERVRRFINHGRSDRYVHTELGHNFRLTDLQSALGRVQLGRLDGWNERRRANARYLNEAFAGLDWLTTPVTPPGREHVFHQYTIRTAYRDMLADWLRERGIGSQVVYPLAIHQQPLYADGRAETPVPLDEAERAAREVLSLPVHPGLSEAELERVAAAVRSFQPPAL